MINYKTLLKTLEDNNKTLDFLIEHGLVNEEQSCEK